MSQKKQHSIRFRPGDVVLVKFPFSDLESTKKRPALCLASCKLTDKFQILTVAMITSQIESFALEGDYLLGDWKNAGLLHSSLIRLAKVASLDLALVEKKIGTISSEDLDKIRVSFKRVFKYWI